MDEGIHVGKLRLLNNSDTAGTMAEVTPERRNGDLKAAATA
jgi:hypothetical protein